MVKRVFDVGWRVLAVAAVYAVLFLLLDLLSGRGASLAGVAVGMISGAAFALVLQPLARRLPYRMRTRVIALLVPLYWIFSLSNLVEAWFVTTVSHQDLVFGAIALIVPALIVSWMIAWLFPAHQQEQPAPGIWELLGRRPLLSWVWRALFAGVLFAVGVQLFGMAWGPLISRYYNDPVYIAQAHIASPPAPAAIVWAEETVRGVVLVLALLPVLAVVRGRTWPAILFVAGYIALIDAALEGWVTMLGSAFPVGFRIGEGLDLTTDAIARGVFIAVLLALPAATSRRPLRAEVATAG